jgi:energy-coupling factor transporter ATP-binding protein EcfA2
MSNPIQQFLDRLTGVQRNGSGWMAQCPAHDDDTPSLSIGEGDDGRVLLKCHAGCATSSIVEATGLTMADLFSDETDLRKAEAPTKRLTAEQLARAKGLSSALLRQVGVRYLKPGLLQITYRDQKGRSDTVRQRLRTALSAKEGSRWKKGAEPIAPYGLWLLDRMRRTSPDLLIAEGESDAWTAWTDGVPAIGIPGQSMHGVLKAEHVAMFDRVYVCVEADEGGRNFSRNMHGRLREIGYEGDVLALPFPEEAPDLNDLYQADPDRFDEHLERLQAKAPALDRYVQGLAEADSRNAVADTGDNSAAASSSSDSHDAGDAESGDKPKPDAQKPNERNPDDRKSAATQAVELASAHATFFHSDRDPYVQRQSDGSVFPLSSEAFHEWIADLYLDAHGRALPSGSFNDALAVLKGRARKTEHPVHVRVAGDLDEQVVYLHLGRRRICRVTPDHVDVVSAEASPARFWEPQAAKALPDPDFTGTLSDIGKALDLSGDALLVAVGWLLTTLLPGGPYPVLAVYGPQGSGKSTRCRQLTRLVDPSKLLLRTQPRKEDDLIVAARSSHVLTFDNVSTVSDWFSDALCRIATGGGLAKRTLYSDLDVTVVNVKRPVIINAIVDVVSRSDLADRLMLLELGRLTTRRTERAVEARFEKVHAKALGALLRGVQAALRGVDAVRLPELPRMADAAMWAEAGLRGLGAEPLAFYDAFTQSASDAQRSIIESDLVGSLVAALAERGRFEGTASKLLDRLRDMAGDQKRSLPPDATRLAGELRRLEPALERACGVSLTYQRTARARTWTIEKLPRETASSASSASSDIRGAGPHDASDANDARPGDSFIRENKAPQGNPQLSVHVSAEDWWAGRRIPAVLPWSFEPSHMLNGSTGRPAPGGVPHIPLNASETPNHA